MHPPGAARAVRWRIKRSCCRKRVRVLFVARSDGELVTVVDAVRIVSGSGAGRSATGHKRVAHRKHYHGKVRGATRGSRTWQLLVATGRAAHPSSAATVSLTLCLCCAISALCFQSFLCGGRSGGRGGLLQRVSVQRGATGCEVDLRSSCVGVPPSGCAHSCRTATSPVLLLLRFSLRQWQQGRCRRCCLGKCARRVRQHYHRRRE